MRISSPGWTFRVAFSSSLMVSTFQVVPVRSSSWIVNVWLVVAPSCPLTGLLSVTMIVSSPSSDPSSLMVMRISWRRSPGLKVSVPGASV